MIKRVRVTDIHKNDLFYNRRKKIIGTIISIDTNEEGNFVEGWTNTVINKDLMSFDPDDLSGFAFYGIKYKEV